MRTGHRGGLATSIERGHNPTCMPVKLVLGEGSLINIVEKRASQCCHEFRRCGHHFMPCFGESAIAQGHIAFLLSSATLLSRFSRLCAIFGARARNHRPTSAPHLSELEALLPGTVCTGGTSLKPVAPVKVVSTNNALSDSTSLGVISCAGDGRWFMRRTV